MKLIYLTRGKFARVADEYYERILSFGSWHFHNGYAASDTKTAKGWVTVLMHHLILPQKDGYNVDHIDGDGTNNQPENLRYVTFSQHSQNKRTQSNNTSSVPGVDWNVRARKWHVRIKVDRKRIHVGYFRDFDKAVAARKAYESILFGEYACKNPERPPTKPNGYSRIDVSEFS